MDRKTTGFIAVTILLSVTGLYSDTVYTYVIDKEKGSVSDFDTVGKIDDKNSYLNKKIIDYTTKYALIEISPKTVSEDVFIKSLETSKEIKLVSVDVVKTRFERGELITTRETIFQADKPKDFYDTFISTKK